MSWNELEWRNPNSDDRQYKTVGEGKYGAVLRSSSSVARASVIGVRLFISANTYFGRHPSQ